MFVDYIKHGWLLVPLKAGEKKPRGADWNARANCVTHPLAAARMKAAGLAHAYSGTCSVDIDDLDVARGAFAQRGLDLDTYLTAPDAVRIDSGRPGRAKLIYRLNAPLPSKAVALNADRQHAVQFRCATAAGLTVQDVLPPSPHPDTGGVYQWVGDWTKLPALPEPLLAWWRSALAEPAQAPSAAPTATQGELEALLAQFDPDGPYEDWLRVGMALHHEAGGDDWGLDLWDTWSATAKVKYIGRRDLEVRWRGFGANPNPVTAGSLRRERVATVDEFPDLTAEAAGADDPWAAVQAEQVARFEPQHATWWANRPAPEWLIDGVLPQADFAMVRGPSGSGKSFLALDMALAIAGDADWNGKRTDHGPVAWIAAEAPGSMRNRLKAYAHGHNVDLKGRAFWVIGETPDLSSTDDVAALIVATSKVKPRLIVVDTLAQASGGANENSGEDMGRVLAACRALRKATGAIVLLVHHTGKDASKGARGWSGMTGAMDVEIEVTRVADSKARLARIYKQRDGEDGTEFPFQLLSVSLDMEGTTSCIVEHFASAQMMVEAKFAPAIETHTTEPHFATLMIEHGELVIECSDDLGDLI